MTRSFAIAAATALCLSTPAAAATVAYQVDANTTGNQSYTGVLGMDFVVNQSIDVLSLGAFDADGDGLNRSTTLVTELWSRDGNQSGQILASTSFTSADAGTLVGGSLFKTIAALTLGAGQYSIVSYGYNSVDQNGNKGVSAGTWTTNDAGGALSFVGGSRFGGTLGGTIGDTLDSGPDDRYAAGTFSYEISAVPVPAALPLMLIGLGAFGLAKRRKTA
ncbi:VPLPA-CTERM sorting domain-containing protein [Algirhabdus cladophorae]|uniref:VPLPA-CTERM sorting domain-containing protein n=1 Tax=Algirhabdus cladophorae TaxID=3377108 RepID=UPI003B849E8E